MKKKHPEHVNLERWLVSYADFITLLFAFFVIMYALSQADLNKFQKVSAGIRQAFSSGPVGMIDLGGSGGGTTANPFDIQERAAGRIIDLPAGKTNTASDPAPDLQSVREMLEEAVSLELGATEMAEQLQMQYDSRGLVVRIATKDFFSAGQVGVREDFLPVLDRIARIILKSKRLIRVEGHTDAGEVKQSSGYASDWELSAARAAWVAKYWIKKFDADPTRLGIAGYAHYRPLSEKQDHLSRAKNRRVEIIILNNSYDSH